MITNKFVHVGKGTFSAGFRLGLFSFWFGYIDSNEVLRPLWNFFGRDISVNMMVGFTLSIGKRVVKKWRRTKN